MTEEDSFRISAKEFKLLVKRIVTVMPRVLGWVIPKKRVLTFDKRFTIFA